LPLVRLLILPDPANVFAPSDNAILLPLLLPEAPIGILPTTSPPARSTAEVDMSAFDENMDPSSSSLSSSLKRDRDSPAEVKPVGTKVRIGPNVGWRAFYTGIFGNTLATYAPIPAVIFSFSLLLSTPDPGPGCTWPGCSSWVPTRISNPRLRGTQAQKPRPRSEKPWRWAWP